MKNITVKSMPIKKLLGYCNKGIFAVPEIQRELVWKVKDITSLLDSIYKQLPIGSMLIWKTGAEHKNQLRTVQKTLPPYKVKNTHIWFIIDGQQRLSVLYRSKEGGIVCNDKNQEINFEDIYFVLDRDKSIRFTKLKRPKDNIHIPVKKILSRYWKNKLNHLTQKKSNEVKKCRDIMLSYKVPMIFLETKNLDEIRESFLRINSGGMTVTSADRAFTRASQLNLRYLVKTLRECLPHGFDRIEPGTIQFSAALIMGEREVGARAVENALARRANEEFDNGKISQSFNKQWKEISDCINKAVDYLHTELGMLNLSYLPSRNILASLAFFFYANNRAQPNSLQKKEIKKWFWATSVADRYSGRGWRPNIQKDVVFFEKLGKKRKGRFTFTDYVPKSKIKHSEYNRPSSLNTAYFLLLCKRKPLYLETASRIPVSETASLANRKDKHHIFPKALLRRNDNFTLKETNSICNICFIVAEENQSIGCKKPSSYLGEHKKRKQFARVMKSHLIPYGNESGLWITDVRKGYRTFQNQRLVHIYKAFEKEAGIKLFRDD